jgi:NAD(P)H-nitrite reductase large subunit
MPKNTIICRCEDLTLAELQVWLAKGYTDMDEIKRLTRAGMGPCQGRTCRSHIVRELSKATEKSPAEINLPTFRPPTKPVSLKTLAGSDGYDKK